MRAVPFGTGGRATSRELIPSAVRATAVSLRHLESRQTLGATADDLDRESAKIDEEEATNRRGA